MNYKTTYYATDGTAFESILDAIEYDYNSIDISDSIFSKIFWVDIEVRKSNSCESCSIKSIIPLKDIKQDYFYQMIRFKFLNQFRFLYIENKEALDALKSLYPYLNGKDRSIISDKNLKVGLNFLRDERDSEDIVNVKDALKELLKDLKEIKQKKTYYETIEQLIDNYRKDNK